MNARRGGPAAAEQQRIAAAVEQRLAAAAAKVNFKTSDHLNFLVSVLSIHEVH